MCIKAVEVHPWQLEEAPDHFKTQKMCEKAVEEELWRLYAVPDRFKTQGMCNKAVEVGSQQLKDVPDWFVTQQQLDIWYDDNDHDDKLIECFKGYQKRRSQKASLIEELMPIAWHPDHVMDWCMSEDKKGWWK